MEMTVKHRLIEFIKYLNISTRRFEGQCGLSFGYIANLKSSPTSDKIMKILNAYPNLSQDWLLTGEGEMILNAHANHAIERLKVRDDVTKGKSQLVPLYNLDVRGGFDNALEDGAESVIAYIPWPDAHADDFAVEVSGMSMLPVIPPGSRVLLRKIEGWQTYLEMNVLYTLELEDYRRLLKEVHASEQGHEYLMLHSYNPRTPDQDIAKSFIRRVYKVVGIMTNYGF